MIEFNVMIYRMLVESSVGAEAAQESDNFLVNYQFVVPESRLRICRKVTLFILTFEWFIFSDQIILIFTTLSSLHLAILPNTPRGQFQSDRAGRLS